MAETKRHYFRIKDQLFDPAEEKKNRLGMPLTAVITRALQEYLTETDEESMRKYGGRLARQKGIEVE